MKAVYSFHRRPPHSNEEPGKRCPSRNPPVLFTRIKGFIRLERLSLTTFLLLALVTPSAKAFTYRWSWSSVKEATTTVVHPTGYKGRGEVLKISLGLHPDFKHLEEVFQFSGEQAVATWNALLASTETMSPGLEIPVTEGVDVLGVLLHEVGHALGLSHPGYSVSKTEAPGIGQFATANMGPNGKFDLDPGNDGFRGTADDDRGDDINASYFKIADNNPFTLPENGVIDSTTYSLKLEDLPSGHRFPIIASRQNARELYSLTGAMAMMATGGSLLRTEVRRGIGADDVAGLRYAMSGLDEIQGTKDDYTILLEYVGIDDDADIVISFDKPETYAAAGSSSKVLSGSNHRVMNSTRIRYNSNPPYERTWYFPNLKPFDAEIREINARAVSVRFKTEKGKRYAVTWPVDHLKKDEQAEQIIINYNGENMAPTNGTTFFFIANEEEVEIKIAFPERAPDSNDIVAGEIVAEPLPEK